MNKIEKVGFTDLSEADLASVTGGKGGVSVNIDIPWGSIRDGISGFIDGFTGKKRHY